MRGGASTTLPKKGTTLKVSPSSAPASTGQSFHPARSTSPLHKRTIPLLISWSSKNRSVIRRPTHAANTTASIARRQPLQMEGHTRCRSMCASTQPRVDEHAHIVAVDTNLSRISTSYAMPTHPMLASLALSGLDDEHPPSAVIGQIHPGDSRSGCQDARSDNIHYPDRIAASRPLYSTSEKVMRGRRRVRPKKKRLATTVLAPTRTNVRRALEAARVGETRRGGAAVVARILLSRPTGVTQGLLLSWHNVI